MHVHAHDCGHAAPATGRRLAWSIAITAVFIVVEVVGALKAGSLALLSDAGHNVTDALALGLAWLAFRWQQRPPDATRTFGYHRAGVLAAAVNAMALAGISLLVFFESYRRLLAPREIEEGIMVGVAAAGLLANLAVMKMLHADSRHDLNVRGAYWHMFADAMSSVAIIVGGALIAWTGALWIDPALSAGIGALILWGAVGLLRETTQILLEGAPNEAPRDAVCAALREIEGVEDVHDLHIWSLSSNAHALSCHALIADLPPSESDAILRRMNDLLAERFGIRHTTIQFEHRQCVDSAAICSAATELAERRG